MPPASPGTSATRLKSKDTIATTIEKWFVKVQRPTATSRSGGGSFSSPRPDEVCQRTILASRFVWLKLQ